MNNRDKDIIKRIENGERYRNIAEDYGISKQRVVQIYRKYKAEKTYNESTDDLEKLVVKVTGHGLNYYVIMGILKNANVHTLEDLLHNSTDEIVKNENRWVEINGERCHFVDDDKFYTKRIDEMKKKAVKIIAKRGKES